MVRDERKDKDPRHPHDADAHVYAPMQQTLQLQKG